MDRLDSAFKEALASEVRRALNSDDLGRELGDLVTRFWARLSLPLLELSARLFNDPAAVDLTFVRSLEHDLARALARVIRDSGYRYAESLVSL